MASFPNSSIRAFMTVTVWCARLGWLAGLVAVSVWLMAREPFTPPHFPLSDEAAIARIQAATDARINRGWLTRTLFAAEHQEDGWRILQAIDTAARSGIELPRTLTARAAALAVDLPAGAPPPHNPRLATLLGEELPSVLFVLGPSAAHYLNRVNPRAALAIGLITLAVLAGWFILRDTVFWIGRHALRRRSRELVVAGPRISRDHT